MRLLKKEKTQSHKIYTIIGVKIKIKKKPSCKLLIKLFFYKLMGYKKLYIPVSGIGDGILFTPVAKAIAKKEKHKVLVAHKNNELLKNNPYIQTLHGIHDGKLTDEIVNKIKKLNIDIIYPTYWHFSTKNEKIYLAYPKQHIITEIASKTGYTGEVEIKPEIYLTEKEKQFGRFSNEKKQIVIMSTALDKHKQWDKWQELANLLKDQYYLIQLGGPNDIKLENTNDFRGKYTLRECASILYNSDLFVGQIGGLMHMARAVNCPSVIAYSSAEPDYLVKYNCNENIYPTSKCNICTEDGVSPYSIKCKNDYICTKSISIEEMQNAIERKLKQKSTLTYEIENVQKSKNIHLDEYYKRYSNNLVFMYKNEHKN